MKNKIMRFYIPIICIILLVGCKSEVIRKDFDTQIDVTVVDNNNQPLEGVTIAVFDSLGSYQKSILSGTPQNSIALLTTAGNGKALVTNLPEIPESNFAKDVWVGVFYKSKTLFPGYTILYDNDSINYKPAETLRKGSINQVTLKLKPAEGLVTFYVDNTQNSRLPIYVYSKENLIDTLESTQETDLEAQTLDKTTSVFKKGAQTWRAKSQECDWYGVVNVAAGTRNFVKLPQCEIGQVAFYSKDLSVDSYPIYIRFLVNFNGGYDTVAVINSAALGFTPIDCSPDPDVVVSFPKGEGKYTYEALAADGSYSVIGNIDVKRNDCTLIEVKSPK